MKTAVTLGRTETNAWLGFVRRQCSQLKKPESLWTKSGRRHSNAYGSTGQRAFNATNDTLGTQSSAVAGSEGSFGHSTVASWDLSSLRPDPSRDALLLDRTSGAPSAHSDYERSQHPDSVCFTVSTLFGYLDLHGPIRCNSSAVLHNSVPNGVRSAAAKTGSGTSPTDPAPDPSGPSASLTAGPAAKKTGSGNAFADSAPDPTGPGATSTAGPSTPSPASPTSPSGSPPSKHRDLPRRRVPLRKRGKSNKLNLNDSPSTTTRSATGYGSNK